MHTRTHGRAELLSSWILLASNGSRFYGFIRVGSNSQYQLETFGCIILCGFGSVFLSSTWFSVVSASLSSVSHTLFLAELVVIYLIDSGPLSGLRL